ncbi:MAG TPA: response regulator [Polyangiaceae bacterium]|jgi:CheY-like chemotaxis protein|nr:response regulator [Polyangiaceae bacterium]
MAKILVVEDNPLNLRLLREVLEHRGHTIDSATTVGQASARLASNTPELVLVDIQIPGGGGEQVLREIRENPCYQHLPVIAVTALAMSGDRQRLLDLGFDGYFGKPIDTRAFGPAIESYLKAPKNS